MGDSWGNGYNNAKCPATSSHPSVCLDTTPSESLLRRACLLCGVEATIWGIPGVTVITKPNVQRLPPTPPCHWTPIRSLPSTVHITVDSEVSFNIPLAPLTPPQPSRQEDQSSPPSFVSQAISELWRAAELLPPSPGRRTVSSSLAEDPADLKRNLHLIKHPEEIQTKTLQYVNHQKLKAVTA